MILNLENIDLEIDDEDQVLLLPKLHDHFIDTLLYGRETFSLSLSCGGSGCLELKRVKLDGLIARRRSVNRDNGGGVKWRSKFETCHGNIVNVCMCYHYKKED